MVHACPEITYAVQFVGKWLTTILSLKLYLSIPHITAIYISQVYNYVIIENSECMSDTVRHILNMMGSLIKQAPKYGETHILCLFCLVLMALL
jgi:hypothetical protein